jgi:ABC-type dipeptide/oligopeptide/nickel transport system permease component
VQAALRQDYPVVLGVVVWSAVWYGALLLAADVLARRLDPRLAGQP